MSNCNYLQYPSQALFLGVLTQTGIYRTFNSFHSTRQGENYAQFLLSTVCEHLVMFHKCISLRNEMKFECT